MRLSNVHIDKDGKLKASAPNLPLAGYTFCLTGTLWMERAEVTAEIQRLGGTCVSNVKPSGTILVQGHERSGMQSAKSRAAFTNKRRIIRGPRLQRILAGQDTIAGTLVELGFDVDPGGGFGRAREPAASSAATVKPPVVPIDRERHEQATKRFLEELASFEPERNGR